MIAHLDPKNPPTSIFLDRANNDGPVLSDCEHFEDELNSALMGYDTAVLDTDISSTTKQMGDCPMECSALHRAPLTMGFEKIASELIDLNDLEKSGKLANADHNDEPGCLKPIGMR